MRVSARDARTAPPAKARATASTCSSRPRREAARARPRLRAAPPRPPTSSSRTARCVPHLVSPPHRPVTPADWRRRSPPGGSGSPARRAIRRARGSRARRRARPRPAEPNRLHEPRLHRPFRGPPHRDFPPRSGRARRRRSRRWLRRRGVRRRRKAPRQLECLPEEVDGERGDEGAAGECEQDTCQLLWRAPNRADGTAQDKGARGDRGEGNGSAHETRKILRAKGTALRTRTWKRRTSMDASNRAFSQLEDGRRRLPAAQEPLDHCADAGSGRAASRAPGGPRSTAPSAPRRAARMTPRRTAAAKEPVYELSKHPSGPYPATCTAKQRATGGGALSFHVVARRVEPTSPPWPRLGSSPAQPRAAGARSVRSREVPTPRVAGLPVAAVSWLIRARGKRTSASRRSCGSPDVLVGEPSRVRVEL